MRHKRTTNKLGRNSSLRKATVRDIAKSVLKYQSVVTTSARAKATRILVDRLITLGKANDLAARRRAFSLIGDHELVKILFTEIAPRHHNHKGGYTRILPLLGRRGDNAAQVVFELTEKVVKEKKARAEKPKKEEPKPQAQEIPGVPPVEGEIPVQPAAKPKSKPEAKEKPARKPSRPGGEEKPVEKAGPVEKAKPIEKPKPVEKPRPVEKPKLKAGKPKGLLGGLGKFFRRQKDI
jgi:large subunit ribosomal protein L17